MGSSSRSPSSRGLAGFAANVPESVLAEAQSGTLTTLGAGGGRPPPRLTKALAGGWARELEGAHVGGRDAVAVSVGDPAVAVEVAGTGGDGGRSRSTAGELRRRCQSAAAPTNSAPAVEVWLPRALPAVAGHLIEPVPWSAVSTWWGTSLRVQTISLSPPCRSACRSRTIESKSWIRAVPVSARASRPSSSGSATFGSPASMVVCRTVAAPVKTSRPVRPPVIREETSVSEPLSTKRFSTVSGAEKTLRSILVSRADTVAARPAELSARESRTTAPSAALATKSALLNGVAAVVTTRRTSGLAPSRKSAVPALGSRTTTRTRSNSRRAR